MSVTTYWWSKSGVNEMDALSDFNASTLDPVGPLGGDQGMKVLSEMNEMADLHDEFVKSLAPRAGVV